MDSASLQFTTGAVSYDHFADSMSFSLIALVTSIRVFYRQSVNYHPFSFTLLELIRNSSW
jgi:hypothetical protein